MQCKTSLWNHSQCRIEVRGGFLYLTFCRVEPSGTSLAQVWRGFRLVGYYAGYMPDEFGRPMSQPAPIAEPNYIGNEVGIHLLIVAFLFGLYPAIAFLRGPLRRWQRRQRGLCVQCAYNLTGNVSGTCPECGRAIS
ncbi:MAG: hypothetical protein HY287_12605 [Planctomycetes bacterium]|nr:hypothetical protein [Planctomycetota bacterium]MBI3835163.1 hypothetical protein [Planctomycetota bacterium]